MQDSDQVQLDAEFLKNVEQAIHYKRDMSILHSTDSAIDLQHPQAILATSFSSFKEVEDEEIEKNPIYSFETKPKSGATEYVPSKVI